MTLREVVTEFNTQLPCTFLRRGHEVPIPNGTFVKCIYENSVHLYSTLKYNESRNVPDDLKVMMRDAGVGSVVGVDHYICPLEMTKAEISAPRMDPISQQLQPLEVKNVYRNMYYCVAFRKGLFWARYDWLKLVDIEDLT